MRARQEPELTLRCFHPFSETSGPPCIKVLHYEQQHQWCLGSHDLEPYWFDLPLDFSVAPGAQT